MATLTLLNLSGTTLNPHLIVRYGGADSLIVLAQADTLAHATGLVGINYSTIQNGFRGIVVPSSTPAWIKFDAIPTLGNIAYLSILNPGQAQDTAPAHNGTNQIVPLGVIEKVNGTLGFVIPSPDITTAMTTNLLHAGLSVPARSVVGSGIDLDLIATASGQFLRRDGNNTLGFGAILISDLPSTLTSNGIVSNFVPNQIAFGAPSGGGLTQDPSFIVDNINKRFGVGVIPTTDLDVAKSTNGPVTIRVTNSGTGINSDAVFNPSNGGTATASFGMTGTNWIESGGSTTPNRVANSAFLTTAIPGPNPTLYLGSHGKITIQTGSTQQERINIDPVGLITVSGITSNMIWDPTVGRLGIGPPGFSPARDLDITRGGTDFTLARVLYTGNSSTGGAQLIAGTLAGTIQIGVTSSGYVPTIFQPNLRASSPFIITSVTQQSPVYIGSFADITIQTGFPIQSEQIRIRNNGEVDLLSLSSGGLVKAIVPSGQLIIATAGTDYALPTITLTAGSGIAGGGTLSANRSFDIGTVDSTITILTDAIKVNIITSGNIADNQVNNSILRDSAGNSVIGRSTGSSGDPADIIATSSGQFLKRDGNGNIIFGAITTADLPISVPGGSGVPTTRQVIAGAGLTGGGDLSVDRTFNIVPGDSTITVDPDDIKVGVITTANITINAADNTIIRDSIATSVIGRSANSTGDPADIQATASGQFLRRDGSNTLGFGVLTISDLPASVAGLPNINIIAGAGLTGGGKLTSDRTIDVATADGTIVVAPDNIKVGIITNSNITDDTINVVKLASAGGPTILGRDNPGAGSVKELDIRDPLHLENGDAELSIIANAFSVLGNPTSSGPIPVSDISATASGQFLGKNDTVLGFHGLVKSDIPPLDYSDVLASYQYTLRLDDIRDDGNIWWLGPAKADAITNGDLFDEIRFPFVAGRNARRVLIEINIPSDFPEAHNSDGPDGDVLYSFQLYKDGIATGLIITIPASGPGPGGLFGNLFNYVWEDGKGISLGLSATTISGAVTDDGIIAYILVQLRL